MPKIKLEVVAGGFIPLADQTDYLDKVKVGEVFEVNIKKLRNPGYHRKFAAFVRLIEEHNRIGLSGFDTIRKLLALKSGYVEVIGVPGEFDFVIPRSIAFDEMDQNEFEDFFNKAVNVALAEFFGSGEGLEGVIDTIARL